MPLTIAGIGNQVKINSIRGTQDVKHHLEELGLNVGTQVTVISSLGGNIIIKVKDSRIAIEKTLANKIICA